MKDKDGTRYMEEWGNNIILEDNKNDTLVVPYDDIKGDFSLVGRFIIKHHEEISANELNRLQSIVTHSNDLRGLITYMNYAINNADKEKVIREFFDYSFNNGGYSQIKIPYISFYLIDFLARYNKYCSPSALEFMIPLIFIGGPSHASSIFQLYRSCKNNNIRLMLAENIIKNNMMSYLREDVSDDRFILESMRSLLPSYAELGILI